MPQFRQVKLNSSETQRCFKESLITEFGVHPVMSLNVMRIFQF